MKFQLLFSGIATAMSCQLGAATLTVDNVRQRYPWNGYVDIDYTITYGENETPFTVDDAIRVTVTDADQSPAKAYTALTFEQNGLPTSAGQHRITWKANADGVDFVSQHATAKLEVVHYPPAYCIVDLSGGPTSASYPVSYVNTVPDGGYNVADYKEGKLVLKRIRPGCFCEGSPTGEKARSSNEYLHFVALTNSYYIGLFEVTQKQYWNVMNTAPSQYAGDRRPVEKVTWANVRGAAWTSAPAASSFLGTLRARTGNIKFDLPTESQWEFACRAGTSTPFNDGVYKSEYSYTDYANSLRVLGRGRSQNDGKGDPTYTDAHTSVGGYNPNAFGLYDMHGNVAEMCLDGYLADRSSLPSVEPVAAAGTLVCRGGHWDRADQDCRSAYRESVGLTGAKYGFRIVLLP